MKRAMISVVLLLSAGGCGGQDDAQANLEPVADPPPEEATAQVALPVPGAQVAAHGGTILTAGDKPIEVVADEDGTIEAYYAGNAPPQPQSGSFVVRVPDTAGQIRPVSLTWDPDKGSYRGQLRGAAPVPGPLDITLTLGGQTYRASAPTFVVLEPAARATLARHPRRAAPSSVVEVRSAAPSAQVNVQAPAPPGAQVVVQPGMPPPPPGARVVVQPGMPPPPPGVVVRPGAPPQGRVIATPGAPPQGRVIATPGAPPRGRVIATPGRPPAPRGRVVATPGRRPPPPQGRVVATPGRRPPPPQGRVVATPGAPPQGRVVATPGRRPPPPRGRVIAAPPGDRDHEVDEHGRRGREHEDRGRHRGEDRGRGHGHH